MKYITQDIPKGESRVEAMIKLLKQKDIVPAAFFFLYGKIGEQMPGFVLPPGLSKEEGQAFAAEFYLLFGKYATIAERRKSGQTEEKKS